MVWNCFRLHAVWYYCSSIHKIDLHDYTLKTFQISFLKRLRPKERKNVRHFYPTKNIETHNSSIIDIRKSSVGNYLEHVLCIKLVIEAWKMILFIFLTTRFYLVDYSSSRHRISVWLRRCSGNWIQRTADESATQALDPYPFLLLSCRSAVLLAEK